MAKKCSCCGVQCNNRRKLNERCADCYWSYTHYGCCSRCAIHCEAVGYGPDRDPDQQDYLTACAEGRYEPIGRKGEKTH